MPSASVPRDRNDFNIAIICALTLEAECAIDALDHRWTDKSYDPPSNDDSSYTLGAIGEHNVVIVHMPGMGTTRAASAAGNLKFSYPNVKLALVVGVCGGMPTGDENEEILLGDVVVSKALVEYDFGKQYPEGFKKNDNIFNTLGASKEKILGLLNKLETRQHKKDLQNRTITHLYAIQQKSPKLEYPGLEHDILYDSSYAHKHHKLGQCRTCEMIDKTCESAIGLDCEALGCESSRRVPRKRSTNRPGIHIGTMGCANTVMKSGHHRDTLARNEGIIAVEMEGAGVWRHGPSIVIKGVCDYADSHKRKTWQRYAAATAAACAKAFLLEWWSPEKRDTYSDSVNAYLESPERHKVKTPSDREEVFQYRSQVFPKSEQQASRRDNESLEQFESDDVQSVRPNRQSARNPYNELVRTLDVESNTDLLLEPRLGWRDYSVSLKFEQMNDRKRSIKGKTKGTCEWLFSSPEYKQWIREGGFLIIRGNPGCGKSTLIKYALAQQRIHVSSPKALNVSFFFNDSGTELETSMHGMLRSLLWQLLEEDEGLKEPFLKLCHEIFGTKVHNLAWKTRDLQATFEKLLVKISVSYDVKIFIDAIDECRNQDHDDLIQFFRSLNDSAQANLTKIGIFMTCRRHTVIQVGHSVTIRLEDKNQDDIRSFLTEQMQLLDETREARDNLKTFLENRAEGSFVWIVLVMRRVRRSSGQGANMAAIKSEISQCPQELDRLYSKLLEDIDEAKSNEIIALFQWMCFAGRPMSTEELRIALTIHVSEVMSSIEKYTSEDNISYIPDGHKLRAKVTHLSQGLVDFSSVDPTDKDALVRFYHGSIKDFMREKGLDMIQSKTRYAYNLSQAAGAQLTNTCLRFLSAEDIHTAMLDKDVDYLSRYAFFAYARDHWHEHANDAEKHDTAKHVNWALHTALPAWIQIQRHTNERFQSHFIEGTQSVHIAARYGLVTLANTLLGKENTKKSAGNQPAVKLNTKLHMPTLPNRRESRSSTSTRNNRSPNIVRQSNIGAPRLDRAKPSVEYKTHEAKVSNDHRAVGKSEKLRSISLSRTNHVPVESVPATERKPRMDMIDIRDTKGATPLILAASAGQLDMVTLLCNLEANVHSQDKMERTPLFAASAEGHLNVVKYLLEHGADTDIHTPSDNGQTPLYSASLEGHLEVVKYLFEHGGDIHTTNESNWTPLNAASDGGYLDVVKYLVEHGADVHTPDESGWTPLNAASDSGRFDVVKYLINHGADADIHTPNSDGQTPLYSASIRGHLEVVKYLFEHGADIHTASEKGWTPINAAANKGHLDVVKYLLKHGANAYTPTKTGQPPLYSASTQGHLDIVECLVEHGADAGIIHTTNANGWTSLNAASRFGHLNIVKYLLERGADVHTLSKTGQTPLYSASVEGYLEVVKCLCEHGADIHTPNENGWTPLNVVSKNGYLNLVKYLLERGANIHTPSKTGQTPLYSASYQGHLEVVKYLLEHGSDVHTPNKNGWTPLNTASNRGYLDVVKYLIDHGADTDMYISEKNGWTPLNAAASSGHLGVVKYLRDIGEATKLYQPTSSGLTPLYSASLEGHLEVVKYLLEHGYDIHATDKNGWTPLNAASDGGYLDVVKYLVEHGADVDIHTSTENGWTPLLTTSDSGHLEVVKYLVEHGADADIHTPNDNGWTPLNMAANKGHLGIIKYLLEHGADIHTRSNNGWTPLNAASDSGHSDVVEYLLEHGAIADIDIPCTTGITPLYAASRRGHIEVVKCLLKHGAATSINTATPNGWTPLYWASRYDHMELMQLLLEAGADVNVHGRMTQTPLICSVAFGRKEMSRLLVRYSADVTLMDSYGRTAADWLKLLKTDDELLKSICSDSDPDSPPKTNMEHLDASIASLSTVIIERQVKNRASLLNDLGHLLLIRNDIDHAYLAFQQKIKTTTLEPFIQHSVTCDLCSTSPIKGSRFICKTCPDTDLCPSCIDKYRKGNYFAACKMHEYLEVTRSDSTNLDHDSITAWLQDRLNWHTRGSI